MEQTVTVTAKGQLTLPAAIRASLGIRKGSRLRVELTGGEVRMRPLRPLSQSRGMLRPLARGGDLLVELKALRKQWDREFRGRLGEKS